MMRIPIVFATDENYMFYTCVAITSLAENAAKETFYAISILVSQTFCDAEGMVERLNTRYPNIEVQLLPIDARIFEQAVICNQHVTKATFYRLILSLVLPEEKCIYLDSDVIVTEDLKELFTLELGKNYIAGCRDRWIDLMPEGERESRRKKTGLLSMEQYVNAGVLLFHLEKIRQDRMEQRFLEYLGKGLPFEDQDILNLCCYNHILRLPPKWNLFTLFMGQQSPVQRSGIIHYATPWIRPWERRVFWMNDLWWSYAEKWYELECFQRLKGKVQEQDVQQTWQFLLSRLKQYEKIVIFGYTIYGKELCDWILQSCWAADICFCDNDPGKQKERYGQVPVLSRQELYAEDKKKIYLVASQNRGWQVKQLLEQDGVAASDIHLYVKKTPAYYTYLDAHYYLAETKDLLLRELGERETKELRTAKDMKQFLTETEKGRGLAEKYQMTQWVLRE